MGKTHMAHPINKGVVGVDLGIIIVDLRRVSGRHCVVGTIELYRGSGRAGAKVEVE